MDKLVRAFQEYLEEVTSLKVGAHPYQGMGQMPAFLRQAYTFYQLRVNRRDILGVFLREAHGFRPSAFEKHILRFPTSTIIEHILVADSLPGFVRKRLIERGIPFVVPWKQLHWPELGMDVRARGVRSTRSTAGKLSPATQAVVLHALNGHVSSAVTSKELAAQLGYTAMTMTRALDEIEAARLGKVERIGRQRLLSFPEGRKALWERAKARLRDPVRTTVRLWERDIPKRFRLLASESALAEWTNLNPPPSPVYAVGRKGWNEIHKSKPDEIPVEEPGTCTVQIWRYDPTLFASQSCVDAFSLFLSLEHESDERVSAALGRLMEHIPW
jgi:DNA-binding MarR family transcriptional regulator